MAADRSSGGLFVLGAVVFAVGGALYAHDLGSMIDQRGWSII